MTSTLGNRANNDPSEGKFATFTDILCNGGQISLESAAVIVQIRYNKDMARDHVKFMTGSKNKVDLLTPELGTFHKLQEKLQNSLLSFCKQRASWTRSNFNKQLHLQQEKRAEMKKSANDLKEKNVEETHVPALYFHQRYYSPRFARTVQQALNAYENLTTKKDKFKFVKEKIHIRYLGIGCVDAYHTWSKNKHKTNQQSFYSI